MEKRGDVNLWFLSEFVAAFIIAYTIASASAAIAQETINEKLNIAKDLAMQINALSSVPGDGYIVNDNLHGYSLQFSENKIEVFDNDFNPKGVYYFVKIGDSKLNVKLNKPKRAVIMKTGNEISVSEEIPIK
ncbi:hypothetical protein HYY71_04295 [Candidatus Woesearchaeota archaeon]|nr:hypothetical protein [Candidatus Woesearchaeota archaeon]